MTETTQEERDELRDDPNPQPEDVRRVINDADRLQRAEKLLDDIRCDMRAGISVDAEDIAGSIDAFMAERNG